MSEIRPLGDRVVVRRQEVEKTSAGGIVIPETATKEKPVMGVVISVGPGKRENGTTVELTVKTNDKVLFGKYAGTEVELDGEQLLVLREDDIYGVIE